MRGELSGSPPSILGLDFILSDWQIRQCLQNISNICIRILMMENIRYLDVCVKNLLFMYKVSTYFCRQCLNDLEIPSVWILTMTRLTVPSHGRWSPRSAPLLRPARHRG